MRVVKIVPGSGDTFYCENCLRDTALTKALRERAIDVLLVPLYLPLSNDEPQISRDVPVFFGGINVFLQQHFRLFRSTPRWLDKAFDSQWMLRMAAKREGTTRAGGMGAMTLSMIKGEEGRQAKELDRLIQWLTSIEKPDLVHLSSVMLIGLARRIKETLNVPIVAGLQDEDVWLDSLDGQYRDLCWEAIRKRLGNIDSLIVHSHFYRDLMAQRLRIDSRLLHLIHIGVDTNAYTQAALTMDPPTIGYLSKLTPSLGLGLLVDAFVTLKRIPGLQRTRLKAMGGVVGSDKDYVEALKKRLARERIAQDVEFMPESDRATRLKFLSEISVLSVPNIQGQAFGTFLLEAWAAGVPVVQPAVGAFTELVEATGGGQLYYPEQSNRLAETLAQLLRDRETTRALGLAGRDAVRRMFTVQEMADRTVSLYASLLT